MKKNTMMRIASTLLIAVLLTTCAIGATFAKYTVSDTDSDSARVAKWGVTVDAVAGSIDGEGNEDVAAFLTTYATTTADVKDSNGDAISNSVASTVNLVAPGTNGTLATVTIDGTPEVAVNVKQEVSLTLTGWEVAGAYYCPITITIDGTDYKGMSYASADLFIAAVENALNSDINYAPNEDLEESHTVTWAWAIADGEGQTNELDTGLGDAAVNSNIEIAFEYTATVTQID